MRLFLCISLILLGLPLFADVQVLTVQNQMYQGKLLSLTAYPLPKIVMQTAKGRRFELSCLDVVEIEFFNGNFAATRGTKVVFKDKSAIYGKISGGSPINISVNSPSLGTFIAELEKVDEIIFTHEKKINDIRSKESDVFYLKSGDRLTGAIDTFSKGAVRFEHDQLGMMDVKFAKLAKISFMNLEAPPALPTDFVAIVVCLDRSRLTGKIVGIEGGMLQFKPYYVAEQIDIPVKSIKSIHFRNGRFVYLSDLPPSAYTTKFIPYFPGDVFQPKLDANLLGQPMRLKGKQYLKGIGVYSRTELSFDLQGKYRKFQSFAGIDDEVLRLIRGNGYAFGGSVEFLVYLDGKQKYTSGLVTSTSPLLKIDLDVKNARKLKLVVDYGEHAHCNDLANWAGARLIK